MGLLEEGASAMATRAEQDAILAKPPPLTAGEITILTTDAAAIRTRYAVDTLRLSLLRLQNGLSVSERVEVEEIRHRIGPDIKYCANMERKVGVPVVPVR